MPAIVEELKKETAFAMKKYNWTQQQARQIYNRSVSKRNKYDYLEDELLKILVKRCF